MPILTIDNDLHAKSIRKLCRKVKDKDFNTTKIKIMIQEMLEIASKPNVAGIAASQLGYNVRAFALSADKKYMPILFFNPILKAVSDETIEGMEGCLSVPGKISKVSRYKKIKLAWQDEFGKTHAPNGKKYEMEFEGPEVRVILHEISHCDGILNIDEADEVYDEKEFEKSFYEAKAREEAKIKEEEIKLINE